MLTAGIFEVEIPKNGWSLLGEQVKLPIGRFRMVKLLLVAGANYQHRRYAVEAGENKWQRGMAAQALIVPFLFLENISQPKRKTYNTDISTSECL